MTTAALSPSKTYIEDGVTLNFPVPFRYLAPADLTVDRIAASGTVTRLVLGIGYTATAGTTDAGGTLTLLSTVAGAKLRIRRVTARNQGTDYATSDTFPAESHEAALDRAMLIDQEQDVQIADTALRALLVPDGESAGALPAAAARAGKFLLFGLDGNPLASSGTGADAGLRADAASSLPGLGAGLLGMSPVGSGYADGTAGAAIDRLRNAGLRLSEEFGDRGPGYDNTAAMAAFFNYLETMNGKKGGIVSPWLSECASEINRSAVDWSGITLLGLPGLSGIKSTASYGVLKLGNIADVLIEGVSFTSSYSNAIEDTGRSLLYSYQKSVLRSAIRRCYFSNPNSFTSALTFYARINAADAGATINGLWIERNRFENVGRLAMTLMNRCTVAGGIADPAAAARNVYVRDNYAYNCGAQCPSYASAAAGYLNGMFISLDGDGQGVEVTGNYIERCQGIGIENVAWSDVLIADNKAKDFSKGLSFISCDDSTGTKFPKRVRVVNNRAIGDLTNARNSNLYGLDATSTVEGNYFGSGTNSTQAALIRRAAGFKSSKNTYISTGAASIYAASVESGYFFSDQDTFDNSASGTNNATLRFINAAAAGSEVTNATILKGTGGSAYDQASSASGNVVGPYKDSTGFLQNEYGTINNADADLTLTGAAAMTAYKGVRITGTLTAQRVINWPSRRGIPNEIWNSANWPIQLQVNGVNGSIVSPNCWGTVVFDTSLNSLRFFGPNRAYQGSFTVAGLPSAAGAGRGATAHVTDSAAAPAFGGTVTGGGSTAANVTSNGTSWVYG